MPLRTEIFDRLVIQEAVDGLGIGLGIAFVHLAAEANAPARDGKGEPDIGGNRHQCCQRDRQIEFPEHDGAEKRELKQCGEDAEHGEGKQRVDALGPALDHARKAARLAFQMKAQ